jgi:hypothetical protein
MRCMLLDLYYSLKVFYNLACNCNELLSVSIWGSTECGEGVLKDMGDWETQRGSVMKSSLRKRLLPAARSVVSCLLSQGPQWLHLMSCLFQVNQWLREGECKDIAILAGGNSCKYCLFWIFLLGCQRLSWADINYILFCFFLHSFTNVDL